MRVALFFDGNNFYRSMDSFYAGLELDYDKLAAWSIEKVAGIQGQLIGAYYYTGVSEQSNLDRFLRGLELRTGFFVRREPVVERSIHCPHCESEFIQRMEKRVDTRLVAEMVKMAALNHYDKAVVFSGDEDIVPAIETVASLGKQVYLASWAGLSISPALRIHSFGMIDLSEGIDVFMTGRIRQQGDGECMSNQLSLAQNSVDAMLGQVHEALRYFMGRKGHLSRWYFENKWKPSGPCPPPGETRQQILDVLINQGKVEVFEAMVNGRVILAIRPKTATKH